ncbi:UNVERIFIED_CONTAM: hypothetical protein HDU68_006749, partial [Siphonaria sp. JEL0065]
SMSNELLETAQRELGIVQKQREADLRRHDQSMKHLESKLEAKDGAAATLKTQLANVRTELLRRESTIQGHIKDLETKLQANLELTTQLANVRTELESATQNHEQSMKQLETKLQAKDDAAVELKTQLANAHLELLHRDAVIQRHGLSIKELETKLQAKNDDATETKTERETTHRKFEKLKLELVNVRNQLARSNKLLETQLQEKDVAAAALATQLKNTRTELQQRESVCQDIQQNQQLIEQANSTLKKELDVLKSNVCSVFLFDVD